MGQVLTFPLGGAQREGRIASWDDAVRFVFAGRAAFTLVSARTDRRLMFSVRSLAAMPSRYAVWSGGDAIAMINRSVDGLAMTAYRQGPNDRDLKAIAWFLRKLLNEGVLPAEVELWHDGRCGRCRALLSTPWALARGVDPDCANCLAGEKAG